ncbi:MAG: acetyl-CoA carboxylase subunit beta, partial [Haloplasmataceae bacterium]|nr:acetyl-CoA carboxylase subunit beta [Haloplasmataceae bacterium]
MENFFEDRKTKIEIFNKNVRRKNYVISKVDIPDGLFVKCEKCNEHIFQEDYKLSQYVCPKCHYHFKVSARVRIDITSDKNSFKELYKNMRSVNPLEFPSYQEKIKSYQDETNELDAFICGIATIGGNKVAIGVLNSFFMMGSMGCVVGEKVTRLIEEATSKKLPLV